MKKDAKRILRFLPPTADRRSWAPKRQGQPATKRPPERRESPRVEGWHPAWAGEPEAAEPARTGVGEGEGEAQEAQPRGNPFNAGESPGRARRSHPPPCRPATGGHGAWIPREKILDPGPKLGSGKAHKAPQVSAHPHDVYTLCTCVHTTTHRHTHMPCPGRTDLLPSSKQLRPSWGPRPHSCSPAQGAEEPPIPTPSFGLSGGPWCGEGGRGEEGKSLLELSPTSFNSPSCRSLCGHKSALWTPQICAGGPREASPLRGCEIQLVQGTHHPQTTATTVWIIPWAAQQLG